MPIILNKEYIRKFNKENEVSRQMKVYQTHGKNIWNKGGSLVVKKNTVGKKSLVYVNSSAFFEIQNKLEDRIKKLNAAGINEWKQIAKMNISHFPAGAEDFFDLIRIDITARVLEEMDITPFIANIIQRDDFTNPTNGQWLHPYEAPFKEIDGTGDRVPLVQIKTGAGASVYFTIYGVGFEMDLYNEMFNNIFDMQKVTSAVARGYILKKNDLVVSNIIGFNWPASKIINPEITYTYEQNIYDTIQLAIDTLGQLKDPQTHEEVDIMSGLTLICHSTKTRALNRSLNGELRNGSEVKNLSAVREITRIIPYNTKYQYYGNERITYQGCGKNTAYLLIPKQYLYLALKRDLTHVTGEGDTFGLTSEREAWYFCAATYATQFLGGDKDTETSSEDPTEMTQEYGFIVRIDLPELTEPET